MAKNRTLFKYDLAQNYLFGEELKTLSYYCIFSMTKIIFSNRKIINQIMWLNLTDPSEPEVQQQRKLLVRDVNKIILNWVPSDVFFSQVRDVVSITENEIYAFLLKNDKFDCRFFLNNLVFTSQGTINTYKTILKTLHNEKRLSKELKFEIACHYFISEDLIKKYLHDLPESSKERYSSSDNIEQLKDPSPTLWCWYFNVNEQQMNNIFKIACDDELNTELDCNSDTRINDDRIDKSSSQSKKLSALLDEKGLFRDNDVYQIGLNWALESSNEIVVQCFWEKFKVCRQNKIEILSRFFERVRSASSSVKIINIYMYLYFETIDKNPKNILGDIKSLIEKTIVFHRWQCLFSRTLNFYKEILSHQDNFKIFKSIIGELCILLRRKQPIAPQQSMLKEFMKLISSTEEALLKDMLAYLSTIFNTFLEEKDIESAKYFLLMKKYPDVINVYMHHNSDIFLSFLKNGEFEFIDQCLKEFSTSTKNIVDLKQTLFIRNAKNLCRIFIDEMSWDNLTSLISWGSFFCQAKEIIKMKSSIPFESNGKVIRKILFTPSSNPNDVKLNYAGKVLFWCLGDDSLVLSYKKNSILAQTSARLAATPEVDFYTDIIDLIIRKKWGFISELFCWASCSSEEIKAVKQKLREDKNVLKRLCQMNDLKVLEIFSFWCENEEEKINQLKSELLLMYHNYVKKRTLRKRKK